MSLPFLVAIRDPISSVSFVEGMTFWGARVPFHLAISLAVFAPSAAFLGASFALAARLYVGQGRPVGASTGRLYGLNTLGAIVGATATTIWLIPLLGIQRAMISWPWRRRPSGPRRSSCSEEVGGLAGANLGRGRVGTA